MSGFPNDHMHQLSFSRVFAASSSSDSRWQQLLSSKNITYPPAFLCLRIFKREELLELWSGNSEGKYFLLKTYGFTALSGASGPKNREGDGQIPEGIYQITHFNPESKFHLSMRINYPNEEDMNRNKGETNLGGDIYLHGGQQSTGCIAIGDEAIAELYWLCVLTYAVNPVIPVHIFPCRMEGEQLAVLYNTYPQHVSFWQSLKPFYLNFPPLKS